MWWKTLIFLCLSGCGGWIEVLDPIHELFQYPAWRSIEPKIDYDYYYYLIDEYDSIQQDPHFQIQEAYDYYGA